MHALICSLHRSIASHSILSLGGTVVRVAALVSERPLFSFSFQLCSCLVVLGVFFAIDANLSVSRSSHTISVAASVIVFVVLLLVACFCAPLTFSTEFEADASRKSIRFNASVLGCIGWRSMSTACQFQDVQVIPCLLPHLQRNCFSSQARRAALVRSP